MIEIHATLSLEFEESVCNENYDEFATDNE